MLVLSFCQNYRDATDYRKEENTNTWWQKKKPLDTGSNMSTEECQVTFLPPCMCTSLSGRSCTKNILELYTFSSGTHCHAVLKVGANVLQQHSISIYTDEGSLKMEEHIPLQHWYPSTCEVTSQLNTVMRRLTMGIRSEKCVVK